MADAVPGSAYERHLDPMLEPDELESHGATIDPCDTGWLDDERADVPRLGEGPHSASRLGAAFMMLRNKWWSFCSPAARRRIFQTKHP